MKNYNFKLFLALLLFTTFCHIAHAQDAGATKLLSPLNLACGSSGSVIQAIIYNYGSTTLSNIPVGAKITGSATLTLVDTLKKTITAGHQDTIIFKTTLNSISGGTYNIKVYSNLSGDKNHANDTLTIKLSLLGFPAAPVASNVINCGVGHVNVKAKSTTPGSMTYWYTNPTSLSLYAKGDSISPFLTANTTFYATSVQGSGFGADTTTFAAGNGQTGDMFDVIANKTVTVDSFDANPAGSDSVKVYYKLGSYVGYSTTASAWTYLGEAFATGAGKLRIRAGGITLATNTYYGFYVTTLNSTLNYTNGTNSFDTFYNGTMKISGGIGTAGSFASGGTFTPRDWNGVIYYSTPTCNSARVPITVTLLTPVKGLLLSKNATSKGAYNAGTQVNPDEICVGDSFKIDLNSPTNYLNSDYGTKWKLTYTMKTFRGTSTSNFVSTAPTSTTNGKFAFLPKAADADSVYILRIAATNIATGCDTVMSRYIHVNQVAVAQFTPTNTCYGPYIGVKNNSTPVGKLKFVWDFGSGDTSSAVNPLYKYKAASTYLITLSAANGGCSSSIAKSMTIFNAPYGSNFIAGKPFAGQFNNGDQINPDYVCLNDTNTYTILAPKGLSNSDYGTKWIILNKTFTTPYNLGTSDTATVFPSSSHNGTFTFFPKKYADSTFLLTMTIRTLPGNCDSIIRRIISVRYKPTANFSFLDACLGSPVTFKDLSTEIGSTVSTWVWNFGDGKTSGAQNPSHSYATPGFYNVTLIPSSPEGCGGTITKTVQQYPRSAVGFTSALSCNTNISTFTDTSKVKPGNLTTWNWYFGDGIGSNTQNSTHTYLKSGPYSVKLVTTNSFGCKDSASKKVTILPDPVSSFTFLNACVGSNIYFSNTSIDSTNKSTYKWDFGDGTNSTATVPDHIYTANGTYKIVLTVTSGNGCVDTFSKKITPQVKPDPALTAPNGCTGQTISIGDSSHSDKSSIYVWSYGDGGTTTGKSAKTTHTYKTAGTYTVGITISNGGGCSDTQSHKITIIDFPKPSFTANTVCVGNATNFFNNSTGAGTLTYLWDFGDNSPHSNVKSPTHKFGNPGTQFVKLFAENTNGCLDSISAPVKVNPLPNIAPWTYKKHGYQVTFVPQDTTIGSFTWHFGTSTNDSSAKKSPTFIYPATDGKYLVTLVVTNSSGCVALLTDSVSVSKSGIESLGSNFKGITVYPNPFEGSTHINYNLSIKSRVNLGIYDAQGKLVAQLRNGEYPAGDYSDEFDANKYQAAEGTYFLKMNVNDLYYTTKIVNMK